MSEYFNLTKQLNPKVIDGRIYVDFEALIIALFTAAEAASKVARDLHDPALGVMALGQTQTAEVLKNTCEAIAQQNN